MGDQGGIGFYDGYNILFDTGFLGGGISIAEDDNGNPDLTWETSRMTQAGIEFTLGQFLDGSVDYYIKDTDNLIFDRRVGPSQGIAIITVNDGELRNSGLEFNLTGHLVNTNDFRLDLNVNGELLDNEIITMPLEPSTGEERIIDTSPAYYAYSEGSSIYDFYVREYAGVDSETGAPLWNQYFDDTNDNGVLDDGETGILDMVPYLNANPDANIASQTTSTYAQATQKYVGKSGIPDVRGGVRLSASYKSWNFSVQGLYSLGGHAYDAQFAELMSDRFGAAGNNYHVDILDRWQFPGDETNVPALTDNAFINGTSTSTRFITSTDFFTINNARIGYTVPGDMLEGIGLNQLSIFASGDNLYASTARGGFFPFTSQSGNSGRRLYAPMTTFTAGVRVKF
jgi:hypothetical protein